jgi:hypothetical protein
MAMPATMEREWTVEMVRAIPDDNNRYQVVRWRAVCDAVAVVAPRDVVVELALILAKYLDDLFARGLE